MDWESLERRPGKKESDNTGGAFKISVKKVAVRKDQVRTLPDGTVIIVDSDNKSKRQSDDV